MPPVLREPATDPAARQFCIEPVCAFCPAMPPVFTLPDTLPENEQEIMAPRFTPAMPPAASQLPEMSSVPDTVRFFTRPLS